MPHMQVRSPVTASPADLAKFLKVLKDADINILCAGGGDIEHGGEFAFGVEDGVEVAATQALEAEGYHPRVVGVDHDYLDDKPGALHDFVAKVARQNTASNKKIKDVCCGVANAQGKYLVQIYSE